MYSFLAIKLFDSGNTYAGTTIPYKSSNTPFQQHGFNEVVVMAVFCLLAWGVYIFLRKKGIHQFSFVKAKKIKVIERTKITARTSVLLVQYNDRFFLMSQSVDNLTLISEVDAENKNS